jgi:hypothetical protein
MRTRLIAVALTALTIVFVSSVGKSAEAIGRAAAETQQCHCRDGDPNCPCKSSSAVPGKDRLQGSTIKKQSREAVSPKKSPDRTNKQ